MWGVEAQVLRGRNAKAAMLHPARAHILDPPDPHVHTPAPTSQTHLCKLDVSTRRMHLDPFSPVTNSSAAETSPLAKQLLTAS